MRRKHPVSQPYIGKVAAYRARARIDAYRWPRQRETSALVPTSANTIRLCVSSVG